MKSWVACGLGIGAVAVGLAASAGCDGGGTLSGSGGNVNTGAGGRGVILGTAGAGLVPGTGGAGNCGCCAREIPAARALPEIMIVLDTAATMNDAVGASGSKWAAATAGINMTVDATRVAASWGLAFVASAADACGVGDRLPVGSTYEIRPALASRSDGTRVRNPGNRPTRAALEIAAAYLSGRTGEGHRIIALVTDGVPDCRPGASDGLSEDAAGTVRVVSAAAEDGILISVIGIGTSGGLADATLSQMATAGGLGRSTSPAYAPASNAAEVAAALSALVSLGDCTFAIPPPPTNDGTTSRGDINVHGDATQIFLDPANGWTYLDARMTAVQLHGSACGAVQSGAIKTVFIVFPCHGGT